MAFSIGDNAHTLFSLSERSGTVTGISSISDVSNEIDIEQLETFSYLPEGESKVFDDPAVIQVVAFGREVIRSVSKDTLRTTRLGLARGATISGPLVWKTRDRSESPGRPKPFLPRSVSFALALSFLFPVCYHIDQNYFSAGLPLDPRAIIKDNLFWGTLTAVAMLGHITNAELILKLRALKEDPSAYVQAPAKWLMVTPQSPAKEDIHFSNK